MLRDYKKELDSRVAFIREVLKSSHADGIVFANSGGKDCTLVGIICKAACDNTVGIMLPCQSKRNFGEDIDDARAFTSKFGIENRLIDLSEIKALFVEKLSKTTELNDTALMNIAPRLRMITTYATAAAENRLVAGTGNRSEIYMGYFTKWGDGACDFNPISDLTVTEVYEFLAYLGAPENIIKKAPSAGLFEGQTDEQQMGITYAKIDDYLLNGNALEEDRALIERFHARSEHKRKMPVTYK